MKKKTKRILSWTGLVVITAATIAVVAVIAYGAGYDKADQEWNDTITDLGGN